jgi:hypothetical protein
MRRVDAARIRCLKAPRRILGCLGTRSQKPYVAVTGPSVARSGTVDSEVAPMRSALVALLPVALSCLVLSQAASRRLRLSPRPR